MIIDMERNDLSRGCKLGTVKISKLQFVEEYKDLYHYITEISGILDNSKNTLDIIKALMPGGAVIGWPKVSTLNLLNHQESENRNIYTGSFGYIKSNQDMRFNLMKISKNDIKKANDGLIEKIDESFLERLHFFEAH